MEHSPSPPPSPPFTPTKIFKTSPKKPKTQQKHPSAVHPTQAHHPAGGGSAHGMHTISFNKLATLKTHPSTLNATSLASLHSEQAVERQMGIEARRASVKSVTTTAVFSKGASSASSEQGGAAIDYQGVSGLWFIQNHLKIPVRITCSDILSPAFDLSFFTAHYEAIIQLKIEEAMSKMDPFQPLFRTSKKGGVKSIIQPVSISVNFKRPSEVMMTFCPPQDVTIGSFKELLLTIPEFSFPISYKEKKEGRVDGVFTVCLGENFPIDDDVIMSIDFSIIYKEQKIHNDHAAALQIICNYFSSNLGINLVPGKDQASKCELIIPRRWDKRLQRSVMIPRFFVTYNASNMPDLLAIFEKLLDCHGIPIHIDRLDSGLSDVDGFGFTVDLPIADASIVQPRPKWCQAPLEKFVAKSQFAAKDNSVATVRHFFTHIHQNSSSHPNPWVSIESLYLSLDKVIEADLIAKAVTALISEEVLFSSVCGLSVSLVPFKRIWTPIELSFIRNPDVMKGVSVRDLGEHLTTPFGLPSGHDFPPDTSSFYICLWAAMNTYCKTQKSKHTAFNLREFIMYHAKLWIGIQANMNEPSQLMVSSFFKEFQTSHGHQKQFVNNEATPLCTLAHMEDFANMAAGGPVSIFTPLFALPEAYHAYNIAIFIARDGDRDLNKFYITNSMLFKADRDDAPFICMIVRNNHFIQAILPGAATNHSRVFKSMSLMAPTQSSSYLLHKNYCHFPLTAHLFRKLSLHNFLANKIPVIVGIPFPEVEDNMDNLSLISQLESMARSMGNILERLSGIEPCVTDLKVLQTQVCPMLAIISNVQAELMLITSNVESIVPMFENGSSRKRSIQSQIVMAHNLAATLTTVLKSAPGPAPIVREATPQSARGDLSRDSPVFTPGAKTPNPLYLITPGMKHPRSGGEAASPSSGPDKALDDRTTPASPVEHTSIDTILLKIISVFRADNVYDDIDISFDVLTSCNTFNLLGLFSVNATPVSQWSVYEAVMLSMQACMKEGNTNEEWDFIMNTFKGKTKFDLQKMHCHVLKNFQKVADNPICPLMEMTFNEYLVGKRCKPNKWGAIPANHALGEPALIAQLFQLNLCVIWRVRKAWRMWTLPYGGSSPVLMVLFSSLSTSIQDSILTVSHVGEIPRFFSINPVVEDWENSSIFSESFPESQHGVADPIAFKVGDKEFAFQSKISVDGSEDSQGSSEVTTSSFFNSFVDEDEDIEQGLLPTPPEIKEANITRLQAKIVQIKAVNALNAQFIRNRHIQDDDD